MKNRRPVALMAALGLSAGLSGCAWVSSLLAQAPVVPSADPPPRAQVIARVGDGIALSAAKDGVQGAIALPPVLAQPSRFVAEKTTAAVAAPKVDTTPVARMALVDSPAPAMPPAPQPVFEGSRESELLRRLESWRRSWESGRFESYSRFYDGAFRGGSASRAAWESGRKERLGATNISVKLSDVRTTAVGPDEVRVDFVQQYASARHRDTGHKTMTLRRDPQRGWVIVEESWRSKA